MPTNNSFVRHAFWAILAVSLLSACSDVNRVPESREQEAGRDGAQGGNGAQTPEHASDRRAIRALLSMQQDAWNAGDVEAYMAGYWRSDSLRFASGGSVRFGWDSTLARYRRAYPDRNAMGELTFSDVDIDFMGEGSAGVFGRWYLKRGNGYEDIGGLYTLTLRKLDDGWRIIADHTSSGN